MTTGPRIRPYPLDWPITYPRTKSEARTRAKFQSTWRDSQKEIRNIIKIAAGMHHDMIISCNINPGDIFAEQKAKDEYFPGDPGVSVSFIRKNKAIIMACDKWSRPRDNLKSLAASIQAIHKLSYWGCSQAMEQAYSGLEMTALAGPKPWWQILDVDSGASEGEIRAAWKRKVSENHAQGRGEERLKEYNIARDQGIASL